MTSTSKYANDQGYGLGAQAVALAARYIGVPYVWGGESPQGFDCSGLVQFVYGLTGVKLPRTAAEQAKIGITVPYSEAQPGDLLIYSYSSADDHVGIYAGGGQQIDAPRPGRTVEQAAVDVKHLTSVVRPFGSSSSAASSAAGQAGFLDPLSGLTGGGIDAAASYLTKLALTSSFVIGGIVLVALGLWRGTKTPDGT
jgi:hypothetical protein